MPRMKKVYLVILLVVIVAAAIGLGYYWYQQVYVKPREVIVLGTIDKITVLDPAKAYDFFTWEVLNNIGEGLLKYKPGTTELVPGLAESYEVSEDLSLIHI